MVVKFLGVFAILYVGIGIKDVQGTPFELVDQYIENFENQLNYLKTYLNVRSNLEHKEEDFVISGDEKHETDIGEYDFIIVGAGSSGSVLANRLSEIPEWKILLLEAGNVENKATRVPSMHNCLRTASSPYTWGYYSTPQNYSCLDMEERRCYIPTAKTLGGITAINDMVYTRGNKRDYDLWADTGLRGWCWDSLFPYFKKLEDAHLDTKMDNKLHSYGGPIYLESPRHESDVANKFLEAGKEIGLNEIDINGKDYLGLGVPQLTTKAGQRHSVYDAYLSPCTKRKNLDIKPLTHVTKIIISEHTKESRAVQFIQDGHLFTASAKKEIILAGGAINTAKLLLLSGIGPEEDLKSLKIEPVMNLKVGHSIIDHIGFPLRYTLSKTYKSKPPFYYSKSIDYLRNGNGPLTSPGVDLVGFIKTEYAKGKFQYPDVELLITSNKFEEDLIKIKERNLIQEEDKEKEHVGFTVNLILLHPKSRGTLKLKDHDPLHHPLIDLNALSDENDDDVETLLSAIRTTQKLIESPPVQKLHPHLGDNYVPNCEHFKFDSDDYWRCAIRHLSFSLGHVSSTAPMGIEKDDKFAEDSVVDSKLRVIGVEKLRIADDSVIPVSISGNLAAIKMVIGEKCADLIKEEWAK